jgi:multisubunit Na+/H+ antiporter MnhB subunit
VVEIVVLCTSATVLFVLIWWAGDWKRWELESVRRIANWLVLIPGGLIVLSLIALAVGDCNS